jgi:hypothetical protein
MQHIAMGPVLPVKCNHVASRQFANCLLFCTEDGFYAAEYGSWKIDFG